MTGDGATEATFVLPVGTVTLLLADVAGSTRLWEEDAEKMAALVAEQDEIVRHVVGRHGGVRPVEQGEGDSFVAAFARASDAVACALELQRTSVLTLRLGLHTGEVQLRDEGNYVGQTIIRAARLRDAAHGGQVVLSRATHDLVLDRLPDRASMRDLGSHYLKSLDRPEHTFQLCHPDLGDNFPSLRSVQSTSNNLPTQLTSFIGRRSEIDSLARLLDEQRLITLHGAGGCGKTRLALQVAAERIDEHADGVWFVDLAPVEEAERVWPAILSALGLPIEATRSPQDTFSEHVGVGSVLLILDNCEHLLDPVVRAVDALVQRCPGVRILATSRAPLDISGESLFRVPSLALPKPAELSQIGALAGCEAIALFVERAQAVRQTFALDESSAEVVAGICTRLDGIPLAIELAAARVRNLPVERIGASLHDRLDLLAGGRRSAMPRQQTLRASVDWSYDLLDDDEAKTFRRLGAFVGDFDLAAAEAVCAGDGIAAYDVLELVSRLVDRALVVLDESVSPARYRLLEVVRFYAVERLREADEESGCRARQLDLYLRRYADGAEPSRARAALANDRVNLTNVLTWALNHGDREGAARLAVAMSSLWRDGSHEHGRQWLSSLIESSDDLPGSVRAGLHFALAGVCDDVLVGAAAYNDCLELARQNEVPELTAAAAVMLGHLAGVALGLDAARPFLDEALAAGRRAQCQHLVSFALSTLSMFTAYAGDITAARELVGEALREAVASDDPSALSTARQIAAHVETLAGNPGRGFEIAQEGLGALRSRADRFEVAQELIFLAGVTCCQAGAYERARELSAELEAMLADTDWGVAGFFRNIVRGPIEMFDGDLGLSRVAFEAAAAHEAAQMSLQSRAWALLGLCFLTSFDGDVPAARRDSAALEEVVRQSGFQFFVAPCLLAKATIAEAEGDLASAEDLVHQTLDHQRQMGSSFVVPESLERLARIAAQLESDLEAVRLLGGADAIRDATGARSATNWQPKIESLVDQLRGRLGHDAFEAAWAEGRAMDTDQVIAYAARGRGERKRPSMGWESLTPTEWSVVDLVAEGLTNKQIGERMFVSARTVQSHLRSVFAKVGVATRSELAARAVARRTSA